MEEVEFCLRYCLAAEFYLEVVGIRLNGDEIVWTNLEEA